jgi:diguanylate cyclase (GGDEF)-like protein
VERSEPEKVISFNERHYKKLMEENAFLKAQLRELVEIARENQRIQDQLDALETSMLQSRSIREMARVLVRELKRRFGADLVKIYLCIDQKDVLYKSPSVRRGSRDGLFFMSPSKLMDALHRSSKGPMMWKEPWKHDVPLITQEERSRLKSGAVVPLLRAGELMGAFLLGSKDPDRYDPEKGTEFLKRLGTKIALVADNVLTHQRLEELSITDQVTTLFNRRLFEEALSREIDRCRRHNVPLCCLLMDIDGLKAVKEQYGNRVRDEVLRHLAGLVKGRARRHDIVARYEGDEFAVLLPQTSLESAERAAQKHLLNLRSNLYTVGDESIDLRISMGLASLPDIQAYDKEALLREAYRCLDEAKRRGGNLVVSIRDRMGE